MPLTKAVKRLAGKDALAAARLAQLRTPAIEHAQPEAQLSSARSQKAATAEAQLGAAPAQRAPQQLALTMPTPPRRLRLRIPRVRPRPADRLEGAEVPLPPMRGQLVRVESGQLVVGDGAIRAYAEREGPWGPLQPLVDHSEAQEIFVRELDGVVYVSAGVAGRRYKVELPRGLNVERLAQRIAILTGIPLSERNPQDSGEFHGWRVNIAMPQLAGGWQISAARVTKVEPFAGEPLLLTRLLTLLASPSSVVFVGPPGSGKTTALIGVLSRVVELWPKLRVSIVEEEFEVAAQVRGPNVVCYQSFSRTVTENIRATRRYDRPDVLVVGELRGEEVPSWFEAAGSGIPVLTTAHSTALADAIKRLNTLIQAAGLRTSMMNAVRVWVVCGKAISSDGGIQRGVQAVYVVMEDGFQPVYRAWRHLPEDDFLALLPPELQLSLGSTSEVRGVYAVLKRKLDATAPVAFERFERIPFGVVAGEAEPAA